MADRVDADRSSSATAPLAILEELTALSLRSPRPTLPFLRSRPVTAPFLIWLLDLMSTEAAVAVPPRATKSATIEMTVAGLGRRRRERMARDFTLGPG